MLRNNIAMNLLNICKNYCATNVDKVTDVTVRILKYSNKNFLQLIYLLIYSLIVYNEMFRFVTK